MIGELFLMCVMYACNHAIVDIIITSSFSLRNNNNHRTRKKTTTTNKYEKGELFVALGLVVWEQKNKRESNKLTNQNHHWTTLCVYKKENPLDSIDHRHLHHLRYDYHHNQFQAFLLNNTIYHIYFSIIWFTMTSSDGAQHHGQRKFYHRSFVSILYLSCAHYCHWWQLDFICDDSIPSEISISSTSVPRFIIFVIHSKVNISVN